MEYLCKTNSSIVKCHHLFASVMCAIYCNVFFVLCVYFCSMLHFETLLLLL